MSDDIDNAGKTVLRGIASRRENTSIFFYKPSSALSSDNLAAIEKSLSPKKRWPKECYYRILAADLLPPDVRRALYLDGDVLCTGGLGELFALDLKGCPCAMCQEADSIMHSCNRLGYPLEEGYFNSGVILFNLDLWREENISGAMFAWLAANAKKCMLPDQDLINAVLHGRILPLDFSYDVMEASLYVFYWIKGEENGYLAERVQFLTRDKWPALLAAVERPRLVHMHAYIKPWFIDCPSPFAPVWRYFYAQSPWANEPLQWRFPLTAKARIKRLGRRAFEAMHLISKAKPTMPSIPYPEETFNVAQGLLDRLIAEDGGSG